MWGKSKRKTNKKVMIALSGGIDSAVSAVLCLRAGYEVEAAFMKNWSATEGLLKNECPWLDDRREALKVAAQLQIPLHTFDFEKEYSERVMEYFFREYSAGRTPNPDVMCNKEIKFKLLYEKAMSMGFDYLATGHYAQIRQKKNKLFFGGDAPSDSASTFELIGSKDEFKDQTYFIYNIKQEQLAHILFPIGGMKKEKVRELARELKLPNAERKESMGLCFVGKIELDRFLQQHIPVRVGNIVDTSGNILGSHSGTSYYTLGQREGLKIGGTGPYYVVAKNISDNTLVVSNNQDQKEFLFHEIEITDVNWISKPKRFPFTCQGRFRHQQELMDITVSESVNSVAAGAVKDSETSKNGYKIAFKNPQRAIASGQSMVLYKGKICLGGGIIV